MSLSKNKKIEIIIAILLCITTIWGITYTYSADLIYSEFNPPDTISNAGNILNFQLKNYGEKTGSYFLFLSASSDDIQFSKNRNPLDDYENNISLSYKLGPGESDMYNFKLKINNSNIKPNVTVTFIYIDTSPCLLKKKVIYEFDYELNENNNYKLIDKKVCN